MKEQFAKAYDALTVKGIVKKINDDIADNKGRFHIVSMTKMGIEEGVIIIWESDN